MDILKTRNISSNVSMQRNGLAADTVHKSDLAIGLKVEVFLAFLISVTYKILPKHSA